MENLDRINDLQVTITVELGKKKITINELLSLNHGSIVELNKEVGEPFLILANGTPIAKGEIVVVNNKYGIRITELLKKN